MEMGITREDPATVPGTPSGAASGLCVDDARSRSPQRSGRILDRIFDLAGTNVVHVEVGDDDTLLVRPASIVTPAVAAFIREHKTAIIAEMRAVPVYELPVISIAEIRRFYRNVVFED